MDRGNDLVIVDNDGSVRQGDRLIANPVTEFHDCPAPFYHYHADSVDEVFDLAHTMACLPVEQSMKALSLVFQRGLMVPGFFGRQMLKLVLFIRGQAGVNSVFRIFGKNHSKLAENLWLDVAHCVLIGTDTEDSFSCGGWSQREIDIFVNEIVPQL